MSESTKQSQGQALTPEQQQMLVQLEQVSNQAVKALKGAKEGLLFSIKACEAPHRHACDELAELDALREEFDERMVQQRESVEYGYVAANLQILSKIYDGSKRMLDVQLEYDRKNLTEVEAIIEAFVATEGQPAARVHYANEYLTKLPFRSSYDDTRYLEARAQMHTYLGLQHWMANVDGIDGLLRACNLPPVITPQSEQEEAGRIRIGEEIKAEAEKDRDFAVLLGQCGTELSDAEAFFNWGINALRGIAHLPLEAKRAALEDPDWLKLNGKTIFLSGLVKRLQAFPEVAGYFPEPSEPIVPYEQLEWHEPAVSSGTGRLSLSGRPATGPLTGGTGPLKGGTGPLKSGTGPLGGTGR